MKKVFIFNSLIMVLFFAVLAFSFFLERNKLPVETMGSCKNFGTVIIDPGHGGEDGGAVGLSGTVEKNLNLDISKKLRLVMNLFGIDTKLTRSSDTFVSESDNAGKFSKSSDMRARARMVNNTPGCTLISIHQNSFPEESCHGAQVFYSTKNTYSKIFAEEVQSTLKSGVDPENRRKAKISDKTIYMLNNTNCPSILIECGFLTNGRDAELLKDEKYQKKLAACITAGYLRYENMK